MSWKDNLRQASFRGIPFKVMDADASIGRRNILHQYPFKDVPYVEDLGADADEFSVNAYIVQNLENDYDYFGGRDALITAIKKKGSGILVHPFLGELTVAVLGKAKLSESFSEGGIARFSITFIQAGENLYPQSPQDNVGAIDEAVEESLDIAQDSFGEKYSQTDMPGFVVAQAISDLVCGYNMIKSTLVAVKNTIASTVSAALSIIEDIKSKLSFLVNLPCSFASSMMDSFNSFFVLVGLAGDIFSGFSTGVCSGRQVQRFVSDDKIDNNLGISCVKSMVAINRFGELPDIENASPYGGQVEEIPVDNYIRAQEKANRIAYKNLMRASVLLKAMQVASRIDYYSFEDCFSTMSLITDAVDIFLLDMGNIVDDVLFTEFGLSIFDENLYNSIKETKRVFIKSMKQIGATFSNIIEYEIGASNISTLQLAYDLYNDLDRCSNIFERNIPLVKHPGFLPGGQTIEVLSE